MAKLSEDRSIHIRRPKYVLSKNLSGPDGRIYDYHAYPIFSTGRDRSAFANLLPARSAPLIHLASWVGDSNFTINSTHFIQIYSLKDYKLDHVSRKASLLFH